MTPADIPPLVAAVEDFIDQPPRQYDAEPMEVRDYRHDLYRVWSPLRDALLSPKEAELVKPPREYEASGDAVGGGAADNWADRHTAIMGKLKSGEINRATTLQFKGFDPGKRVDAHIPTPLWKTLRTVAQREGLTVGHAAAKAISEWAHRALSPTTPSEAAVGGIPAGMVPWEAWMEQVRLAYVTGFNDGWRDGNDEGDAINTACRDDGLDGFLSGITGFATPKGLTASHDAARERIARIISPEGWAKIDAGARGPWVDGVRADTLKQADAILAALPTPDGAEKWRHKLWMVACHATGGGIPEIEGVDRSINDICVQISAHKSAIWKQAQEVALRDATPPPTDASERMRETFNEGLWTGWRAGLAGEQMNDDYASTSWDVSDAAAQLDTASERMREAGQ